MYTLGIPNRQYRRATQILGPENANPIEYDTVDQGDGFYVFSFDLDYDGFEDIVMMLKHNGVTTIGADDQLTERNIMKLTDLLKEQSDNRPNRMESAEDVIEIVDEIITDNPDTALDLLSDMVEDFKENQSIDTPDVSLQEKKLKKLIQTLIKEWHEQN
tara:strand:- start:591 stop:1067 length:477 start_codon:yes stop_codon:yes gene_type:complete